MFELFGVAPAQDDVVRLERGCEPFDHFEHGLPPALAICVHSLIDGKLAPFAAERDREERFPAEAEASWMPGSSP